MFIYMQEHPSQWSDGSFPYPADVPNISSIIYSQSEDNDKFLCPPLVLWFPDRNQHGPWHFQGQLDNSPQGRANPDPFSCIMKEGTAELNEAL